MKQYLQDLQYILDNGVERPDRTGTGTIGVFGLQTRYNLREKFPATTTKKLAWKAVVSELLWFLEGSGSERRLAEILHGQWVKPEQKTIWTANANSEYWKPKAKFEGDLGRVYGVQWRSWNTHRTQWTSSSEDIVIDQVAELIEGIKKDPYGRRHIITAWNPAELDQMALPPCHCFVQFYVANGELSCQMYQRSADMFLGVPFNIASYSLLTHMIAQVCDLTVGDFVHTIGDAHIYLNHIEQVKEQLARVPFDLPKLDIDINVTNINDFDMDSFELVNYASHGPIKAEMAV